MELELSSTEEVLAVKLMGGPVLLDTLKQRHKEARRQDAAVTLISFMALHLAAAFQTHLHHL